MRYLRTKFLITQLGVVLLWQMKILENKKKEKKKRKKKKKKRRRAFFMPKFIILSKFSSESSDEKLHAIDQFW